MADDTYEGWAILELMGHRKLAGHLHEVTLAGAGFLRLDIPAADGGKPTTQFYPPSSVYCLTPTTEELARAIAARFFNPPVSRYELPAAPDADADADLDDGDL